MEQKLGLKRTNILLIISIIFLSLFIIILGVTYSVNGNVMLKSSKELEKAPKFLALMYETTPESGEYKVSTESVWPTNGYAFNANLSKCENGSKMTYDKTLRKVKVETNKSDKCYVYFDMERVPIINSISESNVTAKSMTITVNATPGINAIKMYHYSKDDGVNYVTSTSNSYTFNDLTDETDYKIKVKVEDTNYNFSLETSKTVRTGVYAVPVISSVNESGVSSSSITLTVNATGGTNAIKTYYYSKDNGTSYVTSTSNTFVFGGLSKKTQYNFKIKVEDVKGKFSQIYSKSVSTIEDNFATILKNNYSALGMDYHNGLANGANDGSYRFSGANPNNYVCFGPGATAAGQTCPEENQYRIIGVFGNQVKLIKKTSVGNRQWDNKGDYGDNTWSTSLIKSYLNGEYLNSLTSTWSNKIASNTWQVGGMTYANGTAVPSTAYNYEVGANKANTTFNGKIGLMYVSDYGFAAQPQAWTLKLGGHNDNVTDYSNPIAKANNWLFAGVYEWTMSRYSDNSGYVFRVYSTGYMDNDYATTSRAVRPSFNLESFINLNGGNGSAIDPYRI